MRINFTPAWSFTLAASAVFALKPTPARPSPNSNNANGTLPVLLPVQPLELSSQKCKKKNQRAEEIRLSLIVTSDGKTRRITFLHPLGNDLDQKALDLAHGDRFTPAMRDGEAVAAWQSLIIDFQSCREKPNEKNLYPASRLISQPIQKLAILDDQPEIPQIADESKPAQTYRVGGSVSAPVPLLTPEAHYSDPARRKRISGICLISMIVDAQGMPQNPRVVRTIGYGLDEKALEAVTHYRFKPALKAGFEPVPVILAIEVNFRLY